MGRMECRSCQNAGTVYRKVRKQKPDGTTETVEVPEKCRACDGNGWVEGRTGS